MTKEKFNLFGSKNSDILGEKGHSTLLKRFLNPNGSHGQGDLFLRNFVTDVLRTDYVNHKWVVIQEAKAGKGSADLVIRSENSDKVFVVENKICGAPNQQSQLYRYWRNRIYGKEGKVIYLTFDGTKKPNSETMKRPASSDGKYDGLPEILPIDAIMYISFKNEISQWLKKCLQAIEVSEENRRLIDALKQYIEFLTLKNS